MARVDAVTSVWGALRNRGLRSALGAYALSCIVEWALWTTVMVHTYERSGAAAAGFVVIALSLPAAFASPLAGAAADGTRPTGCWARHTSR